MSAPDEQTAAPLRAFDAQAYIETVAPALGLPVAQAEPAEVAANLAFAFALAPLFLDFPLPDETEPAPIFDPAAGRGGV